jgi:receptor protein-tyrosine kinase
MESTNTEQSREQNQENIFLNFFCFRNIFETAIRYWHVAVLCALLGTVISFVATKWLIEPIYTSKATVFSWRAESEGTENISEIAKSNYEFRQLQMAQMLINDYRALLESELVRDDLKEAVKNEFLRDYPQYKGDAKKLKYSINIETQRETRMLRIVAQARTPELAEFVAERTAKIFKTQLDKVLGMQNAKIIDHAKKAYAPSNKSLKRNLPIGFGIGLFVGIALALLIGFIDQTIKNPEQAKRYLDVPVMGVIPKSRMPESRSKLIREMLDNAKSQELIEAYRLLRTNLQYLVPSKSKNNGGQIFMFTSSIPHEGKSSSIALVSLLTARAGKKVLLIDADMHKPVQSRIFNLRSGIGFVSVLTGDKTVEETVQHVEDCLDVMPCGPIPPNPSELLMSERMPQLLDELRQKYDYVFIDITPALFLSDPLIVKPMVDGVLFMVACSQTKIGMIQRTLRQLQQVSKTPIGLVVNQFDRGEVGNRYGYYGYYRYHSYYRYYRDYATDENGDGSAAGAKKPGANKGGAPKQA